MEKQKLILPVTNPTETKPVEPPKEIEAKLPEPRWTRSAEGQYSRGPYMPDGH